MTVQLLQGDCRDVLTTLDANSVHCVVTRPPYWGLWQYSDAPREIGQESAITDYIGHLVEVFAGVKRVLRPDGVLWLNLGDS